MRPYAAPTDSRFITIALAGTTSERNTTVSSTNESASTSARMIGLYLSETSKKSLMNALSPPTSTVAPLPANAAGTYSVRSFPMASVAASLCVSTASPASGISTRATVPS